MPKRGRHANQADLFDSAELFPVRAPTTVLKALDFNRRLANAMSEAIRLSGKPRLEIAQEMTLILGLEDSEITIAQLNAYTSAARETHTISLVRFIAFVRATGCSWLWDAVLHDEGLLILEGKEAHLAQAALWQKQGEQLLAQAQAALAEAPAQVRVRRGR